MQLQAGVVSYAPDNSFKGMPLRAPLNSGVGFLRECLVIRMCVLLVAVTTVLPLRAQEQISTAADTDTAEVQAHLSDVEAAGLAVFTHDRAAAVATDALLKLKRFRKEKRVAGWVTEEKGENIAVTFVGPRDGADKMALYRATVTSEGVLVGEPVALESPEELTAYEAGAFAARSAALASDFPPCAPSYNPVVLPAPNGSPFAWRTYLLPATKKQGVVPLGGTYRIDVSADGKTIVDRRGFTRTCIQLGSGPDVHAMMVTHLLDPEPTEVHVFWSLWAGKPLYVSTSDGLWQIEDGEVRAVEDDDEEGSEEIP